jgi:hypothetical protein
VDNLSKEGGTVRFLYFLSLIFGGDLVAYYSFDGDTLDHSSNGNDGTNHGATFVDGVYGQALSFDGVNDYVDVGDRSSLDIAKNNSDFTISAWIKTTGSSDNHMSLSKGHNSRSFWYPLYYLQVHPNGTVEFALLGRNPDGYGFRLLSLSTVNDGKWHHIAGLRSNNTGYLYIDGVMERNQTDSVVRDYDTTLEELQIGRLKTDGSYHQYFNGSIDEVKIHNHALSESEIQAEFERLIAYYSFDGDTLDHSGNDNNGTNHGATFVNGVSDQALSFDGTNDYVELTSSSWANHVNSTIMAWIRMSETFASHGDALSIYWEGSMSSSTPYYYLHVYENDAIRVSMRGNSGTIRYVEGSTNISDGKWHHVSVVRTGEDIRIYIDGVEESSYLTNNGGPINPGTFDIYTFGTRMRSIEPSGTAFFNGSIDEVEIYNRALNESEVRAEYEKHSPKPMINIYTDKSNYTYIDVMTVGLDVSNPGNVVNVGVYVWVDLPGGGKKWVLRKPSVNLAEGLDFSRSHWKTHIFLDPTPIGEYAWHAVIYDHSSSEMISESIAPWTFIG